MQATVIFRSGGGRTKSHLNAALVGLVGDVRLEGSLPLSYLALTQRTVNHDPAA